MEFCIGNGYLNMFTGKFTGGHDPNRFFTTKLDVKYDPNATCHELEDLQGRAVPHSSEGGPLLIPCSEQERAEANKEVEKRILAFYQMVAYSLTPRQQLQVAFLIIGGTSTSKGFLNKCLPGVLRG